MTPPIIDTHQHLVYPEKWPYSWTSGVPQLAGKAFRYPDYQQASAGTGIAKTIFMETAPDDPHYAAEAGFVYELAAQPGSLIAGVIASCRPEEKDGFESYLESIRHPKLVGLRRILHVMPDELSASEHFAANLRLLPKYNLTYDLCFLARQLPAAIALARRCEGVQMILDHCGVPDVAGQALDPWREHIRTLAALPNVACKISGVMAYGGSKHANIAGIRSFVEHCLECFGWDRIVWGGDWPVCNLATTLADWVSVSRELVASASAANQKKLFHDNAVRIYGLDRKR